MQSQPSNFAEFKLAATLSGVIALRMLGLFMMLPVFMVLARDIPGFTPVWGGLAVGIYGLTQAVLQQPFGWLSDRWGRKPVLLLGLGVFACGGVVAAGADSMAGLVFGRALQGCGAIAGVAMAFAADFTRPEKRPVIMAVIGIGIGAAFLLSMAVSVPLANVMGLNGLFWLTAGFGVLGMLLVLTTPSGRPVSQQGTSSESGSMKPIWFLALSVFQLHAVMTLLFVVLPGRMIKVQGFALAEHWKLYVPTMLLSALSIFPVLSWVGARKLEIRVLPLAFASLGIGLILVGQQFSLMWLAVFVTLYFVGFNLLEATMPSLVATNAGNQNRGRTLGLYSTFQFLGAFVGGVVGGIMLETLGSGTALLLAGVLCLLWGGVVAVTSSRVFLTNQPHRL